MMAEKVAAEGVGAPQRHRFLCPKCEAELTPWLRELSLTEALCAMESETWLLPRGTLLSAGTWVGPFQKDHPWVMAPQSESLLRPHPELSRVIGCCGLSYRPGMPNLICARGHEVGYGYRDCCGPHWYALSERVTHEVEVDPSPVVDARARLAWLKERVARPLPEAPAFAGAGGDVWHDSETGWDALAVLAEPRIDVGGGESEPVLVVGGFPGGAEWRLPVPWPKLVGLVCLEETPWGDSEVPLVWQRAGGPQVNLSRSGERVLCTAWGRKAEDHRAAVMPAGAWEDAWFWLREGVV